MQFTIFEHNSFTR